MPRHYATDDDWDDGFDVDNAADDPTEPCPHCGEPVYEDADRCPYCGSFISDADRAAPRKPWWILLGVAVCLYLVYRWTFG